MFAHVYDLARFTITHANPLHVAFTLPALVVVACIIRTARECARTFGR